MPVNYTKTAQITRAANQRQALGFVPKRQVTAKSGGGTTVDSSTNEVSLDDTAVSPGTYGDATNVASFTVDQKGRITDANDVPITFPADHGITQLTGDVTAGPGDGSQGATLANSGVSAGTYGDSTHVAAVTFDAKGRATGASPVAIVFPVGSVTFGVGVPGGTPTNGDLYFDTTAAYVGYVGNGGTWHQF